ncbi:MAG: class II aldolase and adducin N-terminal domain-containing protein [Sulfurimonas sp.]
MSRDNLAQKLFSISLSLFRKDFFGLYHGSLSAKTESNRFLINKKEAIFDALDERSLVELSYKQDYRWQEASVDAPLHHAIYSQILDAKFVSFTIPPFITAYSLKHNIIEPKDYFGSTSLGTIEIVDPKSFDDWYERAITEIPHYFLSKHKDIMVIRGYGVFAYNMDLYEMVKKIAILERSVRLMVIDSSSFQT